MYDHQQHFPSKILTFVVPTERMARTHVVVGGGSSGLALVKRLLERDNVILIERGNVDLLETPAPSATPQEQWFNIFPSLSIWCHRSFVSRLSVRPLIEEQRNLLGRQIAYAQGFGGGGSGGVNAMIYTLGNSLVYDQQWPKSWTADRVMSSLHELLKYYSPQIVFSSGNMEQIIRTGDTLSNIQTQDPASIADNKGAAASYYTSINETRTGRINQAFHCLSVAENTRGKLTILSACQVQRVTFKGREAESVFISQRIGCALMEKHIRPENGGEIIMCAGVFETPRILISSGLKRADTRTESPQSIEQDTTADTLENNDTNTSSPTTLPNLLDIGENLQDHFILPYMLIGNWYKDWKYRHGASVPTYGGQPAYPLNGVHGWVNLTKEGDVWTNQCTEPPTVQLLFIDGRVAAGIIPMMLPRFKAQGIYSSFIYPQLFKLLQYITGFAAVRWLCGYFFGVLVCLTQPRSRGHLSGNLKDKQGPMRIDPNYLSHPADLQALYNGFQTARQLVHQQQVQGPLRCVEVFPGPLFGYAANLKAFTIFAKLLGNTYFHACGTCAMSNCAKRSNITASASGVHTVEGGGVVDEEFRVLGVTKLRVADASVIPAIPSSPTQALCMVLGEACGQLVLKGVE